MLDLDAIARACKRHGVSVCESSDLLVDAPADASNKDVLASATRSRPSWGARSIW